MKYLLTGYMRRIMTDLINKLLPQMVIFLILCHYRFNIDSFMYSKNRYKSDCNRGRPWIFDYLKSNIALNSLTNVMLLNNALLDRDNLDIEFFAPKDKFGKGSLSPVFTSFSEKVMSRTVDSVVAEFSFEPVDLHQN
ncbi:MAG: hypothetical protein IPP42_04655 [Saprospiraceae bacterium]|nr:hypothetical protein [Saprospiraceae bacterium]